MSLTEYKRKTKFDQKTLYALNPEETHHRRNWSSHPRRNRRTRSRHENTERLFPYLTKDWTNLYKEYTLSLIHILGRTKIMQLDRISTIFKLYLESYLFFTFFELITLYYHLRFFSYLLDHNQFSMTRC